MDDSGWERAEYVLPYPKGRKDAYLLSGWREIDAQCDAFEAMRRTIERDLATLAAAGWELDEREVVCPADVVMRHYDRSVGHLSGGSIDPLDCLVGVLTLGFVFLFVDCVEPQDFEIGLRRPSSSHAAPGPTSGSLTVLGGGAPGAQTGFRAQAA